MRPIDADALKDYIDAQEGRPFIGCTVGQALKIMTDEQPTIQPELHWIPCSEGLPKEEGFYLVTLKDKFGAETTIRFFRIENGERHWSLWGNENITAWMPKPEPYKEVNV